MSYTLIVMMWTLNAAGATTNFSSITVQNLPRPEDCSNVAAQLGRPAPDLNIKSFCIEVHRGR